MSWEMIATMTPVAGLMGLAVWRFSRVEEALRHGSRRFDSMEETIRHNSQCQNTCARMIGRLNRRVRHHRHDETGRMETIPDGE